MANSKPLALPPLTPELKSISPYLQRADELKSQDPIVAYWCAYYAAQLGISLKARDTPSRDVLLALLGTLERMKREIGPHDAIDIESVSAAYVENFALRVFAMADNEDRRGNANRATAKKFLAAANFLDVLKTFPKSELSESNEEKIRYSKWKAADIAKAFREGRKPTPGPAGSDLQPEEQQPLYIPSPPHNLVTSAGGSPPDRITPHASPPQKRNSYSPPAVDIARARHHDSHPHPLPITPPRNAYLGTDPHVWNGDSDVTPGNWSTAATPGTTAWGRAADPDGGPYDAYEWELASPTTARKGKGKEREKEKRYQKKRSGSGSSNGSTDTLSSGGGTSGGSKKKAWVSEELESPLLQVPPPRAPAHFTEPPEDVNHNNININGNGKKSVHFTPSVIGGLSSVEGTPPVSPANATPPSSVFDNYPTAPQPPSQPYYDGLSPSNEIYGPEPPTWNPSSNPSQVYYSPPVPPPAPAPIFLPIPPPSPPVPVVQAPPPPASQELEPEVELTTSMIAKAQKHCRFAISALDYEDAEQARRELKAALAVLGG